MPEEQTVVGALHLAPQEPQCKREVCVFTHLPEHSVRGGLQVILGKPGSDASMDAAAGLAATTSGRAARARLTPPAAAISSSSTSRCLARSRLCVDMGAACSSRVQRGVGRRTGREQARGAWYPKGSLDSLFG